MARKPEAVPQIEMRNVWLQVDDAVVLEVRRLRGEMVRTAQGEPPFFDEPGSFELRIFEGEIAITPASMAALMNRYVLAADDAPVKDVELAIEGGRVRQKGTLNRAVPVPFSILADVAATEGGDLVLRPVEMKAAGLPVKALADLFDVELDEVLADEKSPAMRAVGDDLILDPERMVPPPRIQGAVAEVRVEEDRLVQVFAAGGERASLSPSDPDAANYLFISGGVVRFGKLTMEAADLQLVDADPTDPFVYSLAANLDQLVAGYSRTQPDDGLVVWMPDFDEVERGESLAGAPVRTAAAGATRRTECLAAGRSGRAHGDEAGVLARQDAGVGEQLLVVAEQAEERGVAVVFGVEERLGGR